MFARLARLQGHTKETGLQPRASLGYCTRGLLPPPTSSYFLQLLSLPALLSLSSHCPTSKTGGGGRCLGRSLAMMSEGWEVSGCILPQPQLFPGPLHWTPPQLPALPLAGCKAKPPGSSLCFPMGLQPRVSFGATGCGDGGLGLSEDSRSRTVGRFVWPWRKDAPRTTFWGLKESSVGGIGIGKKERSRNLPDLSHRLSLVLGWLLSLYLPFSWPPWLFLKLPSLESTCSQHLQVSFYLDEVFC